MVTKTGLIRLFFFVVMPLFLHSCKKDPVEPSISVSEGTFEEGTTAQIYIRLSAAFSQEVRVTVTLTGVEAKLNEDFTAIIAQTIVFAPGETEKILEAAIKSDPPEPAETFHVGLSNPVNASIIKSVSTETIQAGPFDFDWIYFKIDGTEVYMGFNPTHIPPIYVDQFFIGGSQWFTPQGIRVALGLGRQYSSYPNDPEHWQYCITGGKPYAQFGNGTSYVNGFFIEYTDPDGITWKSQIGAHGTSDKFNVTGRGDSFGNLYDNWYKGEFNCLLYNGSGQVKAVTNGRFFTETPSGF